MIQRALQHHFYPLHEIPPSLAKWVDSLCDGLASPVHCIALSCSASRLSSEEGHTIPVVVPAGNRWPPHPDGTMEESLIKKTFKMLLGRARGNQERMLQDIWVSNVRKPLPVTLIPQTASRDPRSISGAAAQGCFAGAVV